MISTKVKNSVSYRKWIAVLLTIILLFLLAGGVTVSAREEASVLILPDTQVVPVGEIELGISAFDTVGTQEGASVFILPDSQVVPVDGETEVEVRVSNVSNLYGVEFHLSFDAEIIEVIDADPTTDGIQINPGDLLVPGVSENVTSLNQANNSEGTTDFAMTLVAGDEPVSGSGILATIGLRRIGQGSTEIIFENPVDGQAAVKLADGDGKPITVTWAGGLIESSVIPGDADDDNDVDIFDMTKVARIILELDAPTPGADADQDGDVDIFDMTKIARIILELD